MPLPTEEGQVDHLDVRAANLALKFGLEMAAVAAFAIWGATVTTGLLSVVLAIASPLAAIILWGRFAAPRAPQRLPMRARVPFELAVFTLATVALLTASAYAAIAFASAAAINTIGLTAFGQWDA